MLKILTAYIYVERDSKIGFRFERKLSQTDLRSSIHEALAKPKIRFLSRVWYNYADLVLILSN